MPFYASWGDEWERRVGAGNAWHSGTMEGRRRLNGSEGSMEKVYMPVAELWKRVRSGTLPPGNGVLSHDRGLSLPALKVG